MIHFRDRLHFWQYIPSKRNRYGVKLSKLCDMKGYTYRVSVYIVQDFTKLGNVNKDLIERVVLQLVDGYLN